MPVARDASSHLEPPLRLFFGAVGEGGGCSSYSFTHAVLFWLLDIVEVYKKDKEKKKNIPVARDATRLKPLPISIPVFGCDVGGDSRST